MRKRDLEKRLDEEILNRAKIMSEINKSIAVYDQLQKEKKDSDFMISKLKFQINEKEETR